MIEKQNSRRPEPVKYLEGSILGQVPPFLGQTDGKFLGRVSMCTTLSDVGCTNREIRIFMNWKTDKMVDYYTNTRRQMSTTAPAALWKDQEKIKNTQRYLV